MASLTRMGDIARDLPEYELVGEMGGVGRVTRVALIAQIGDVRRFKNKHSLICFAGLTPSIHESGHESGKFRASQNHIVKKGPARLRKVLYQVMMLLVMHKIPKDDAVYRFIKKKEAKGKYKKVAKVAGMAKFLRIYYGQVMHLYRDLGLAA
ncbi:MAG: IS110 family transposase [Veillonellaceae bacterium]|uniref:IS110 family transposase n=1 Tax=Dialister hominis TaxID=2582419 RepID=UPI0024CBB1CE|nr:MAG: IS110 family transposase [Veillonellaceae bacterium]